MTTFYVVVENGFEYNDEIYRRPESDGGTPLKVYKSEEKANKACLELNIKKLQEMDDDYNRLDGYGYGDDEIVKPGTLEAISVPKLSKPTAEKPLTGKSFCVTGTLSRKRDEVHKLIETAGGEVHKSVRKGTTYLIAGDDTGAVKLEKAKYLGTEVISEGEFVNMLDDGFSEDEDEEEISDLGNLDPSKLTRAQLEILAKGLVNPFFEVYQVEGE